MQPSSIFLNDFQSSESAGRKRSAQVSSQRFDRIRPITPKIVLHSETGRENGGYWDFADDDNEELSRDDVGFEFVSRSKMWRIADMERQGDGAHVDRHQALDVFGIIKPRLEELREAAEECGIPYSKPSEKLLIKVLRDWKVGLEPMVTLRPNGELRALWENFEGEQVGIQFGADGVLDYVLFSTDSAGDLTHDLGKGSEDKVACLIDCLRISTVIR